MTIKKIAATIILLLGLVAMQGCDPDSPDSRYPDPGISQTSLTSPTLEKYLTTTDTDGVSFRVRFGHGGDVPENMSCKVHWCQYASKPSKTPSRSDMTKHEMMRTYGSTKRSTTFDRSHAGFKGGMYIYYYFECSNSRFTTNSEVTFCVVKR